MKMTKEYFIQFLSWLGIFLCGIVSVSGHVTIVKPYHPMYIKTSTTLKLLCNSTERRQLQWLRETVSTDWEPDQINPIRGSEFKVRTTHEEPSGNVESVLMKHHMYLEDRGTYTCRDASKQNSYSIWVQVLDIQSNNVTIVPDKEASDDDDKVSPVTLFCNISGFDNNPPVIEYAWYYGELFIPRDHPRFHMTRARHTSLQLTLRKPEARDSGRYNCVAILATTLGPIELVHSAYVDASALAASGVSWLHVPPASWSRLLASLLVLLLTRRLF